MSTRLTKRQNEIRLRGLRILARIIARAHLASLGQEAAGRNDSGDSHAPDRSTVSGEDIPRKEDGRAE